MSSRRAKILEIPEVDNARPSLRDAWRQLERGSVGVTPRDGGLEKVQELFEKQAGADYATIEVEATPESECPDIATHP